METDYFGLQYLDKKDHVVRRDRERERVGGVRGRKEVAGVRKRCGGNGGFGNDGVCTLSLAVLSVA